MKAGQLSRKAILKTSLPLIKTLSGNQMSPIASECTLLVGEGVTEGLGVERHFLRVFSGGFSYNNHD